MSTAEFRTDIWTGRQVIVAAARADRPQTVLKQSLNSDDGLRDVEETKLDPFLEGREVNTPSERLALRRAGTKPDQEGWLLRVVANRYPAVASRNDPNPDAATGIHDVVIECPDFRRCWLQFSVPEVARVLTAWQLRQRQLMSVSGVNSIQIFRNQGAAAGASLGHSHSQVISLNTVPALTEQRLQNAAGFDRWQESETQSNTRIVLAQDLLVVCPNASWMAGQIRICPAKPKSTWSVPFHKLLPEAILHLAYVLRKSILVVQTTLPEASFNLVLNQPPIKHINAFPWSIDIMPRTASFAGFELACDVPIVTTSPESSAEAYRTAWAESCDGTSRDESSKVAISPPSYSWRTM